jgi:flavin reductase (DIM6/NTAB) family NADH-FMN oxidoreductase RutF
MELAGAFGVEIDSERLHPANNDSFRAAMRQLTGAVCLITHTAQGGRAGLTATSVSSLSTDPPSLVVCINRASTSSPGFAVGVAFGVNLLGAHQQEFADRFAGRGGVSGAERFAEGRWVGAPLLCDSPAAFDCEVEDIIERHTHAIVIGRVRRAAAREQGGALVYWRGAYDSLGWSDDEISRAVGATPRSTEAWLHVANARD